MESFVNERFVIKGTKGFRQVDVEAISHVICEDYLCTLYLMDNAKPIVCSKSLRHFEQALPIASFGRVHHNAIVNLRHVREVCCMGRQRHVVMADGTALPISVRKWPAFRDAFQKHTFTNGNSTPAAISSTLTKKTYTPANQEAALT